MSLRDVEKVIREEAKIVFNNRKLRLKDILEWSSSELVAKATMQGDEVVAQTPSGLWVCVPQKCDKRK